MKNLLHNLIDNGIKEGVIKPLPKIIATKESVLRINEYKLKNLFYILFKNYNSIPF